MTTQTCPRCDTPILHGTLCEDCLATLRRDLDDIGVPGDRMYVENLRGCANPLTTEEGREALVERLRAHDVQILVVDPFGPHEGICYGNLSRARADERKRIEKFAIPAWREEIAQEIEAMCPHEQDTDPTCPYMEAARIARGEQP